MTDAKQTNRNLLLSRARVDTKPQLEIFADDVKCTHGATVGQLDEAQAFYLRSRGIGAPRRGAADLRVRRTRWSTHRLAPLCEPRSSSCCWRACRIWRGSR